MEEPGSAGQRAPLFNHVAFLRGMNVGGHRITNADLETHVAAMGFTPVGTYQASGNVLLGVADNASGPSLETRFEQGLHAALGYEVPTFLRHHRDVARIATAEPFVGGAPPGGGKLQVVLLKAAPAAESVRAVLDLATDDDQLTIDGTELYWQPAAGVSDSVLDLGAIERLVGPMTIRTMGTIQRLQRKMQ